MAEVEQGVANVDLVTRVIGAHFEGADTLGLYRDEESWEAMRGGVAEYFTEDAVFAWVALGQRHERYGADGLRAGWLDWFEPWEEYRSTLEEVRPVGEDRVLCFVREVGVRDGAPIEMQAAAIVTIRDDRIAGIDFYATRDEALSAAGLEA